MRVYSVLPRLYQSLGLLTGEEAKAMEKDGMDAYDKINTLPSNTGDNKGKEQKWTQEHEIKHNVCEKLWFRSLLPLVIIFGKRWVIRSLYAPVQQPMQQGYSYPQNAPFMPQQNGQQPVPGMQSQPMSWNNI